MITKKKVVLFGAGAIFLVLLFLLALGNVLPLGSITAIIAAVLLTVDAGFFADAFLTFQHECSVEANAESKLQFTQLIETHKKSLEDHSARETEAQEQHLQQQVEASVESKLQFARLIETHKKSLEEHSLREIKMQEQHLQQQFEKMLEVSRAQQEHPLTVIAEAIQNMEAIEKKGVNDALQLIKFSGEDINEKVAAVCDRQKELTEDTLDDFCVNLKKLITDQRGVSEASFEKMTILFSQVTGAIQQLSAEYQDFRKDIEKLTAQSDLVFNQMRSLQQDDIKFLEKLIHD
jgi:hypothetical protein